MVSVRLKRGVTAEFLKHFAEMLSPVSYQGQTRKVMVRVYCRSKGGICLTAAWRESAQALRLPARKGGYAGKLEQSRVVVWWDY